VDAPLLSPHDLIRPWRRATVVAGVIAAAEAVVLVAVGAVLLAKPVTHAIEKHARAAAAAKASPAPAKQLAKAIRATKAPPGKARPRTHLKIMVFNGNGLSGAAGTTAGTLQNLGYSISGTANAARQDYATTVVMYKPGFRAEGIRLAKDLHVRAVGPLDGVRARALHGGELAVIVGA
jgi:hypothetical protein